MFFFFISISRQGWVDVCYPDYNNEYDKVWHNKLAFYEVGNGDYFAIELEKENYGKIVYLSHDGGDAHGHYIADNFKDLLNNWSKVGSCWRGRLAMGSILHRGKGNRS